MPDKKLSPSQGEIEADAVEVASEARPSPTAETETGLSRRKLLAAAAATAAGAAVLPAASIAQPTRRIRIPVNPGLIDLQRIDPQIAGILKALICNKFREPKPIFPDAAGVTSPGNMDVDFKTFNYCDGNTGEVRSYNNLTPGPSLYVDPGGAIRFTLHNKLPNNPAAGGNPIVDQCGQPNNMNTPHCFNTTNVHFHGLHVSPCSKWNDTIPDCDPGHVGQPVVASDDVLFEVKPSGEGGQPQDYCVEIPEFHAPGTHWYHSHKHGSTAIQVANGLAGALIVRENNPNLIEVLPPPDRDYIWLIQEVLPNSEDWKIYPGAGQPPSRLLVNGICLPCLPARTGQNIRLRLINATGTPRGFARLQLVKDPNNAVDETVPPLSTDKKMNLMAVDGITFFGHKPQPIGIPNAPNTRWWDMSPGNRADVLLQFGAQETGVWKLVRLDVPGIQATMGPQVLGCIEVKAGNFNEPDPATIQLGSWNDAPHYLRPIQQSEICGRPKKVTFNVAGPGNFQIGWEDPNAGINVPPQQYQGNQYIETFLGCAEAWELLNTADNQVQAQPHPFHVHVNPFQLIVGSNDIVKIDLSKPNQPDNRIWWDTIAIPPQSSPGNPGRLVHWTRFWDYPGTFVVHCHILVHEDLGMMANVWVKDPKRQGIGPCVKADRPIAVRCQNPSCGPYIFRRPLRPQVIFDPDLQRLTIDPEALVLRPMGGG